MSDFSFFGFDDLGSEPRRQVKRVKIRGGTPAISAIDDYGFVPVDQATFRRRDREWLVQKPSREKAGSLSQKPGPDDEDLVASVISEGMALLANLDESVQSPTFKRRPNRTTNQKRTARSADDF